MCLAFKEAGMVLRIICFAMFLNASFMSLRVIASLDALGHGATPAEVGVMMALLALFPTFLAITCGRWVDRVGFHKPVLTSASLLMFASVAPILLPVDDFGMYPLYACCIAAGLGTMTMAIVSSYLVGACSGDGSRTKYFAWYSMGNSVAGFSTPVMAGYMIDGFGYWAAFAMAACMVAFGLFMYSVTIKDLRTIPLPKPRKYVRRSWDLLKDPKMGRILIVSSVISMAWDLETFMFPVYGTSVGLSASEVGWLVSTFYVATFLVRVVQSSLSKLLSEWQSLTACLMLTCVAYALFPRFETLAPLMVIAAILGCGLGIANPNILSLIQSNAPTGRAGEAFGIRTMITNGTHFALPMAYGTILAAVSVASLFYICSGLMAASVLMTLSGYRAQKKAKQADQKEASTDPRS